MSEIDTHNVVVRCFFPDMMQRTLWEWYAGLRAKLPQEAQDLIAASIARGRECSDRHILQIFEP
jgi:hypothetical protein